VPDPESLTIVIADDHAVVREGLRMLLESEADFTVVGEATDLDATLAAVRTQAPDVLVLDLHMGRRLSLSALASLRAAAPATAVLILTMEDDPAFAHQAWAEGAAGYVLKEASRVELVRAIRAVGRGSRYLDPAIGASALTSEAPVLTNRELDVLKLVALGHTNTEIGERLFLSVRTVETHRSNLQRKLGLGSRPELVRYALEHGVIRR
jgi:two-component system response regulator NreC